MIAPGIKKSRTAVCPITGATVRRCKDCRVWKLLDAEFGVHSKGKVPSGAEPYRFYVCRHCQRLASRKAREDAKGGPLRRYKKVVGKNQVECGCGKMYASDRYDDMDGCPECRVAIRNIHSAMDDHLKLQRSAAKRNRREAVNDADPVNPATPGSTYDQVSRGYAAFWERRCEHPPEVSCADINTVPLRWTRVGTFALLGVNKEMSSWMELSMGVAQEYDQ